MEKQSDQDRRKCGAPSRSSRKKIEIYYNSPEWEAKINDITAKSITITTDVLESLDLKNFNINMDGLPVPPKRKIAPAKNNIN